MSVPKLRFKDDAGRDFPRWEREIVGDICEFQNGKGHESLISETGKYIVVNSKFIASDGTNFKKSDVALTPLVEDSIVMVMSDVPNGKALAKCYYIKQSDIFTLNQRIGALRSSTNNNKFIYYQINRNPYYLGFDSGVGQTNLKKEEVLGCPVGLPTSLKEQTKIANFLTAIDEKISQLTQKHDLLNQYKKGVMQQIFSQELRFKDDDGGDFPEWEVKNLSEIVQIVGGGTPDTSVAEYWQGNVQWFTPTEIKTKYATNSLRTITESGLKNSSAKILPVGTLLFSSRATVGDVSIALNECTTNQGFQSMIVNDKNYNEFIYYWILNNKNAFLEKASGSTFLEISKKEIEKLPIQCPCIKEQTKIANFLTAIDDKITATKAQLDAVKQYKQGLLQQMFV